MSSTRTEQGGRKFHVCNGFKLANLSFFFSFELSHIIAAGPGTGRLD